MKECCGRLSECLCGFRSVWRLAISFAVRFALDISGGKLSNSGRTGLDLGLVCSTWRVFESAVGCVMLYHFLFALFRRGLK